MAVSSPLADAVSMIHLFMIPIAFSIAVTVCLARERGRQGNEAFWGSA
jgi:hypothetical protein